MTHVFISDLKKKKRKKDSNHEYLLGPSSPYCIHRRQIAKTKIQALGYGNFVGPV
jgi:hypothetical protein